MTRGGKQLGKGAELPCQQNITACYLGLSRSVSQESLFKKRILQRFIKSADGADMSGAV